MKIVRQIRSPMSRAVQVTCEYSEEELARDDYPLVGLMYAVRESARRYLLALVGADRCERGRTMEHVRR